MLSKYVPTDPHAQHRLHLILAWVWFAIGIWGLINYVFGYLPNLADSIPILFGISVYANYASHLSAAQAAKAEVNLNDSDETI